MRPGDSWLLLALPALLGASELLVVALTLAAVAIVSLSLCGLALNPLRKRLAPPARVIAALLIALTLLSGIRLLLQLHSHELSGALGIYLPLLALPCAGLANQPAAAWAGLRPGLSIAGLAIVLGLLREGVGHASLLQHAEWLFGTAAQDWALDLSPLPAIALLTQAPGGFILLGLLLALARLFPSANDRP
jgi:electron transport complex protein RnfE